MDDLQYYEAKLPRFNETAKEDFHLCIFRVEPALDSRAQAPALYDENVHNTVDKQARAIIIAALGNTPLRTTQNCQSIKLAWTSYRLAT